MWLYGKKRWVFDDAQQENKMRILELQSGSGILSEIATELGHTAFTVDINPKINPDFCKE